MGNVKNHDIRQENHTWTEILLIFTLVSFALAQPLFDLLSRNAEFFVARRSQPLDIFLLVFILCIGVPTVIVGMETLLGVASRRLRQRVQGIVVTCLTALIVLQILKSFAHPSGLFSLSTATLFSGAVVIGYRRLPMLRMFLTALSPGILLFPGLFLFHSPVSRLAFPWENAASFFANSAATTPVVVVVFDEFPVTSLMDERRQVDPIRYPHFAALAQQSTWFRNATTVSETTTAAVPAIVSGQYPDRPPAIRTTLC